MNSFALSTKKFRARQHIQEQQSNCRLLINENKKEFSILSALHSHGFSFKSEQSFCRLGHYKRLKMT